MHRVFVAITGASGSVYGIALVEALLSAGAEVHLAVSATAGEVMAHELGWTVDVRRPDLAGRIGASLDHLRCHAEDDLFAPVASGSYPCEAMVVAPCSMSTLGRIATGTATNLIGRAADVMLKERRRLVLVARETPLSRIHLRNMLAVTEAGAVVLPASPGWYHRPRKVEDLVNFVTARVLDQLGFPCDLVPRWGTAAESEET